MDVPAPLVRGAALLRCPVCLDGLRVDGRSLVCPRRHTYDVARHGHVTLARSPAAGDDAEMVAARAAVFEAGHYAPLTRALAAAVEDRPRGRAAAVGDRPPAWGPGARDPRRAEPASPSDVPRGRGSRAPGWSGAADREGPAAPPVGDVVADETPAAAGPGEVVLDIGAGTGHHLAGVLEALPGALGIALDTSRPALRHAARRERVAAVVADVWEALPLRDAVVDLALVVFAPRNGAEIARVLKPGGTALVAIPAPDHLAELAHLHGVRVDPEKPERLERTLGAHLERTGREAVRWTMELTSEEVERVLRMSPAGAHRREGAPRAARVTGSVELWSYRRSPDVG